MNVLDYAAATVGNHEFNYGLDVLERAYGSARFPVVCTNIQRLDGGLWFPPSVVIERLFVDDSGASCRLRLGVIGFAPAQIAQWDEAHVRGRLRLLDIVEAARAEVVNLKSKGVDLIIALCHSGISRHARTIGEENAAQDLAPGFDGLGRACSSATSTCFFRRGFRRCPGADAGAEPPRQARGHGRILGQPPRSHRSRA